MESSRADVTVVHKLNKECKIVDLTVPGIQKDEEVEKRSAWERD